MATFVVECPACEEWTLFGYKRCPNCNCNIESQDGIPFGEFLHPENEDDEHMDYHS